MSGSRGLLLAVVCILGAFGCQAPPEAKAPAAPSKVVRNGPGIIGTWEGTQTTPSMDSANPAPVTTPNTEQFEAGGSYRAAEDTMSVPLLKDEKPRVIHSVSSGSYTYDDKTKTLTMNMLKQTMGGLEAKVTESSFQAHYPIAVKWLGKDQIEFTRGSVHFSLKRKD